MPPRPHPPTRILGSASDLERHLDGDRWRSPSNAAYLGADGDVVEDERATTAGVDADLDADVEAAGDADVEGAGIALGDWVLDLGFGRGRHTLERARRALGPLTGVDRLRDLVGEHALRLFERLACRDYARFDVRADAAGTVTRLGVSPDPGWCWDSQLRQMSEAAGLKCADLLRGAVEAAPDRTVAGRSAERVVEAV